MNKDKTVYFSLSSSSVFSGEEISPVSLFKRIALLLEVLLGLRYILPLLECNLDPVSDAISSKAFLLVVENVTPFS